MENKNEYFIPINEVAKRLDVPAHTLRYWEKQFPGAIRPTTGAGGRRYYRPDVVEKIQTIKTLLYDKGMTIAGVKKILHNGSFSEEIVEIKKENKPELKSVNNINNDEIDVAINLLKQAKMFLD
ncbi:MAG: MerR family transcriptional regulator [Alphaproteobacteria bacterium]|nr:MerR family transcriptional regulator [Alphaproteobacteria bacterium]